MHSSSFRRIVHLSLLCFLLLPNPAAGNEQQRIRIAVKEFPPLVMPEKRGLCIDMAKVICKRHNLVPEFIMYNSVPDFLAAVKNGECQLGFAGITITAEREKFIDFSQPFFDSGLQIAVHAAARERFTRFTTTLLKVIGVSLVLLLLGLTLVAHLIWWLEKDEKNPQGFSMQYAEGIIDAYWWAIVTMTTVGYGDKCPRKVGGRLVAAIWMLIGIMWFAAFTATLSSTLTLDRIQPGKINGLNDLAGRRVAVIRGTTTEDYLRYYNMDMVAVDSLKNMLGLLKSDRVDAVIYDAPPLLYTAKNDPAVQVVGKMFARQRYGIVFPEKGREHLKEIFNREIITMQQNGEYNKIYDKWL